MMYSPLAKRVAGARDPGLARYRQAFGFMVHTTGSGVTENARRTARRPIDAALAIYIASQNGSNGYKWGGPHYVGNYDGTLYQIAPDDAKTAHCGGRSDKYPEGTRGFYLDGTWVTKVTGDAVAQWRKQWPNRRHPYALFPSTDPNEDYIGLELLPIAHGFGGTPMRPGLRFTRAQHDLVIALGRDIADRHRFPAGWARTGRLAGHEDVDILNRSDSQGGWDPGWLRAVPYFDFGYVRDALARSLPAIPALH